MEFKETASRKLPLGSAALLSLVTTPFNRTTIPPIVVRLHTLQLYNYKPLDVQQ